MNDAQRPAAPLRPLVQRLTEEVDARRFPYRLAVAAVGAAVSVYLTVLHYASVAPVGCPEGSLVNCLAVLTSPEATFLGLPVALYGLVFFAGALFTLYVRRRASSPLWSEAALVWALGGAAVVLVLVYTELFVVGRICLWCSFTHALALGWFALELWPGPESGDDARAEARRRARRDAEQAERAARAKNRPRGSGPAR
ncbi:MAG: vitamin K epoxide reductase family protein [Firmicutes bacterium]|nr:vitamin K epoxide reductase family protein [Bacillota bacterium]